MEPQTSSSHTCGWAAVVTALDYAAFSCRVNVNMQQILSDSGQSNTLGKLLQSEEKASCQQRRSADVLTSPAKLPLSSANTRRVFPEFSWSSGTCSHASCLLTGHGLVGSGQRSGAAAPAWRLRPSRRTC